MRNEFQQDDPVSVKLSLGSALLTTATTLGFLIPLVVFMDIKAFSTVLLVAASSIICIVLVVLMVKLYLKLAHDWFSNKIPLIVILVCYVALGSFAGMLMIAIRVLVFR